MKKELAPELLGLLLSSDRQAILGRLSAGLTHVMNNVLGGVIGQADLLMMTNGGPNLHKDLEQVIQLCDEGVSFTKSISKIISTFQERAPVNPIASVEALIILINRIYRRTGFKAVLQKAGALPPAAKGELFVQAAFHLMLMSFENTSANIQIPSKQVIDLILERSNHSIKLSINRITPISQTSSIPASMEDNGYHNWIINKIIGIVNGSLLFDANDQRGTLIWPIRSDSSIRKDV